MFVAKVIGFETVISGVVIMDVVDIGTISFDVATKSTTGVGTIRLDVGSKDSTDVGTRMLNCGNCGIDLSMANVGALCMGKCIDLTLSSIITVVAL